MEVDFNVDVPHAEKVTERDARVELDRLLSDPQFHSTERNRNFLRFVAQAMFEGRAATVKAYTIAVDVFGRPTSFDPTTDPIVRIEATRLRASLAQYYESRAEEGSVRIELPRGRYIPVFTKAPPQGEIVDDCDVADEPNIVPTLSRWRSTVVNRRLILAASIASVAVGFIAYASVRAPLFSEKPTVAIEMKLAGDETDSEAGLIRDYLMTALSQFQTLKLAAGEMRSTGARSAASLFNAPRQTTNPYNVVLKYHPAEDERSVWWQVADPVSGEALRSGVERVLPDGRPQIELRRELVSLLATRFAGLRGVINSIELSRELAVPSLGNGCVLRSAVAVEQRDANQIDAAKACLNATLKSAPNDPDANAELAIVLLGSEAPETVNETTARALALANKAVILAPMSDRAGYAQMLAQFRNGQIEAAFISGYRAMALNPNNSVIPATLGAMFFANGNWAEGVNLATKAGTIENGPHDDAELTLALDAYRRGEFTAALLRVQRLGHSGNYVADVLELAASGQLGNAPNVKEATDRLNAYRDHFWTSFQVDMTARHYAPELIDTLGTGLMKAGLPLPQPIAKAN